ncbi:MAG: hypothetical protein U0361_02670 [Nitrospiraceae bacterium]
MPAVYQSRGLVSMLTGEYERAERDFSRAIELGVSDEVLVYNRGVARSILGDTAGALKDYDRSCRDGYVPACRFTEVPEKNPKTHL